MHENVQLMADYYFYRVRDAAINKTRVKSKAILL